MSDSFAVPGMDKVLLDKTELFELIDQMRSTIPEDIQHAEDVLNQQEDIIAEARQVASRTRAEAEAAFQKRLDTHELVTAARAEAEKIIAKGQQQATDEVTKADREIAQRRQEFNEYMLLQLRRLENNLSSQLDGVQSAIKGVGDEDRMLRR